MQDKSGKMHLWTVLQVRVVEKEKMCAIVNISSQKCSSGKCQGMIESQTHPFLSKTSYVRCDHSRSIPLKKLESLLKIGKIRLKDDFKSTTLEKILKVVSSCSRTPKEVKDFF